MPRCPLPLALASTLSAALSAVGAAPASAAPTAAEVYTSITLPEFARIMEEAGYTAKMVKDKVPYIATRTDELLFTVDFYDCDTVSGSYACGSVAYVVSVTPPQAETLQRINEWNRGTRYAFATLTDDGTIFLAYDFVIAGGVTAEAIRETLLAWEAQCDALLNYVNWPR